MKGTVLVTGGAGSVGRCVAQRLCDQGGKVRVFDLPQMDFFGLEDKKGIEIIRGDLTKPEAVERAVQNVSAVIHLAAIMRPGSEKNRAATFAINVDGTIRLAKAVKQINSDATFVFSSSVATYGDTTGEKLPITIDQPQQAIDIYSESKIAAEKSLRQIYPGAVILRISGISVPSIQSPPDLWPFMADQRIEFIHRDDVINALCTAIKEKKAKGRIFNIAGGPTWRTTGQAYVKDYFDLLGVPMDEARFMERPGWCDWYDTDASQDILHFQNTSYQDHLDHLRREVERMMEE
jgi:nucleoside-diphosphate-sugar epimerase